MPPLTNQSPIQACPGEGRGSARTQEARHHGALHPRRHDLAEELVSTREPRRLPVVLSPEEVGRLLTSATNIKHKALLSLAYATGLRASEVVSLKLTAGTPRCEANDPVELACTGVLPAVANQG